MRYNTGYLTRIIRISSTGYVLRHISAAYFYSQSYYLITNDAREQCSYIQQDMHFLIDLIIDLIIHQQDI